MVSGAGKGTGCCGMSVGRGDRVGMIMGAVSVGDGVGGRGGIRV